MPPARTSRSDLIAPVCGAGRRRLPLRRRNGSRQRGVSARYLCGAGVAVHLVSYRVDPKLAAQPNVRVHFARRTAGSHFLGQRQLDRLGANGRQQGIGREPRARVLVNGGNCEWPDINWVHYVHREWRIEQRGAPLWFRLKTCYRRPIGCAQRGARAQGSANRDCELRADPHRFDSRCRGGSPAGAEGVPGLRMNWQAITPVRRAAARAWLGESADRPLAVFVGALGHDSRKGFDTLWTAWRALCARSDWDANLIVAGDGRALPRWREIIKRDGLENRIRMLGILRESPKSSRPQTCW